ncbi:MAG: hypothetical protein FWJ94_12855 [Acidimicrobiia bacterium]
MSTPARLAAFAAVLVLALAGGAGIGAAVGPVDVGGDDHDAMDGEQAADDHATDGAGEADGGSPGGAPAAGDEAGGHRLHLLAPAVTAGRPAQLRFHVLDPAGAVVAPPGAEGDEPAADLVVVDHDLTTYAHGTPTPGADGTWLAELPPLAPGAYRVLAQVPGADGTVVTAHADLTVTDPGGSGDPAPPAEDHREDHP